LSLLFDNPRELDARDCLLKYYNSEGVAHGSYVLSIAIGFFAFIQAVPYIPEISVLTIPIIEISFKELVSVLVFSAFITIGLYLLARTLFWGVLSGYATHVPPLPYKETLESSPSATNLIYRLNQACIAKFRTRHSCLHWFVGTSKTILFWLRYVVIWIAIDAVLLSLLSYLK
jgi:hypothetical protein